MMTLSIQGLYVTSALLILGITMVSIMLNVAVYYVECRGAKIDPSLKLLFSLCRCLSEQYLATFYALIKIFFKG
jgi:hypothetical protein